MQYSYTVSLTSQNGRTRPPKPARRRLRPTELEQQRRRAEESKQQAAAGGGDTDGGVHLAPSQLLATMSGLAPTPDDQRTRIIEMRNVASHTHAVKCAVDIDEPLFRPNPVRIDFREYEAFEETFEWLGLRNMDRVSRRIKVLPPESPFFRVEGPVDGRGKPLKDSRIASGVEVRYKVFFKPNEPAAHAYDLVVRTEREDFVVPLRAPGPVPFLSFPDRLNFDSTPVKTETVRSFMVKNMGKAPCNFQLAASEPFTVKPAAGHCPPDESFQVTINFRPELMGPHEGEVEIRYAGGERAYMALAGEAHDVDVALSDPVLDLPDTYISLTSTGRVTLVNRSEVPVRFAWRGLQTEQGDGEERSKLHAELDRLYEDERAAVEENALAVADEGAAAAAAGGSDSDEEAAGRMPLHVRAELAALDRKYLALRRQVDRDGLLFADGAFAVEPLEGTVWAHSQQEFAVTFAPPTAAKYAIGAYLDVQGRQERLPLQLRATGVGPRAMFLFDVIDMGDVSVTAVHRYQLQMVNKGEIPAHWDVVAPETVFADKFRFEPASGVLQVGEQQTIDVEFCSDILGELSEVFEVSMRGSPDVLRVEFRGHVVGPTFHADVDRLEFGDVAFGFPSDLDVALYNTSDIPFTYRLRVPQDVDGAEPEFTMQPRQATIEPGGTKRVRLTLCSKTVMEYANYSLEVDVVGVGEGLLSIPISAVCVVPSISVEPSRLDLGEVFVRHPYTVPLTLRNDSALPGRFRFARQEGHAALVAGIVCSPAEGVIPASGGAVVQVEVTAQRIGAIDLPLLLSIDGVDGPPVMVEVGGQARGPQVSAKPGKLNFGRTPCLQEVTRTVQLVNDSLIPAAVRLFIRGARSKFKVGLLDAVMDAGETRDVAVTCQLDDTLTYKDQLHIAVTDSDTVVVPLLAKGVGSTVHCDVDVSRIDFGPQFTARVCVRRVLLENKGRRAQTLTWVNTTHKGMLAQAKRNRLRRRGGLSAASTQPAGADAPGSQYKSEEEVPPPVFTVHPERVTLQPRTALPFTIRGLFDAPKDVHEVLQCLTQLQHETRKSTVFESDVTATFIDPLVQTEPQRLDFRHTFEPPAPGSDARPPAEQRQVLRITNVSALPLQFVLKARPPFVPDFDQCRLAPGADAELPITFAPGYRGDLQSHEVNSQLVMSFQNHPSQASVPLHGLIELPNLEFEYTAVDFGCVLNDTTKTMSVRVTNTSAVPVDLSWAFLDEAQGDPAVGGSLNSLGGDSIDPAGQSQSQALLVPAAAGGGDIPINQVFDIQPIRAHLEPGASDTVEFLFYAHANRRFAATAVADVVGGPEYQLDLRGEASLLGYKLQQQSVDFGKVAYDRPEERELVIVNTGRVDFSFAIRDDLLTRPGVLEILPPRGRVFAGQTHRIVLRLRAGLPGPVLERLVVEVAHFEPVVVPVSADAAYAAVTCSLPRQRGNGWDMALERARYSLERGRIPAGRELEGPDDHLQRLVDDVRRARTGAGPSYKLGAEGSIPPGMLGSQELDLGDDGEEGALIAAAAAAAAAAGAGGGGTLGASLMLGEGEADATAAGFSAFEEEVEASRILFCDFLLALQEEEAAAAAATGATGAAGAPSPGNRSRSGTALSVGAQTPAPAFAATAGQDVPRKPIGAPAVGAEHPAVPDEAALQRAVEAARAAAAATHKASRPSAGMGVRRVPPAERFVSGRFRCEFGSVIRGQSKRRTFRLTNAGQAPLTLVIDRAKAGAFGFDVEPAKVQRLPEGASVDLQVSFRANPHRDLGPCRVDLPVSVHGGPAIVLALRASVTVPDLRITPDSLDFGPVVVGTERRVPLQLHNPTPVPVAWERVAAIGPPNKVKDDGFFRMEPASGVLQAGERAIVTAVMTPSDPRHHAAAIPLRIKHNPRERLIAVKGLGRALKIQLSPPVVSLGPVPSVLLREQAEASGEAEEGKEEGAEEAKEGEGDGAAATEAAVERPSGSAVVELTNPTNYDLEVVATDLDALWPVEAAAIARVPPSEPHALIRTPVRVPGEGLPIDVLSAVGDPDGRLAAAGFSLDPDATATGGSGSNAEAGGGAAAEEGEEEAAAAAALRAQVAAAIELGRRVGRESETLLAMTSEAAAGAAVEAAGALDAQRQALARPGAPRTVGLAVNAAVYGPPGSDVGGVAGALANMLEGAVLTLDRCVDWAAAGGGGVALARKVRLAQAAAEAAVEADVKAANEAAAAAALAAEGTSGGKGGKKKADKKKADKKGGKKSSARAAPDAAAADPMASKQPAGVVPMLSVTLVAECVGSRLRRLDCGRAAVWAGLSCRWLESDRQGAAALRLALGEPREDAQMPEAGAEALAAQTGLAIESATGVATGHGPLFLVGLASNRDTTRRAVDARIQQLQEHGERLAAQVAEAEKEASAEAEQASADAEQGATTGADEAEAGGAEEPAGESVAETAAVRAARLAAEREQVQEALVVLGRAQAQLLALSTRDQQEIDRRRQLAEEEEARIAAEAAGEEAGKKDDKKKGGKDKGGKKGGKSSARSAADEELPPVAVDMAPGSVGWFEAHAAQVAAELLRTGQTPPPSSRAQEEPAADEAAEAAVADSGEQEQEQEQEQEAAAAAAAGAEVEAETPAAPVPVVTLPPVDDPLLAGHSPLQGEQGRTGLVLLPEADRADVLAAEAAAALPPAPEASLAGSMDLPLPEAETVQLHRLPPAADLQAPRPPAFWSIERIDPDPALAVAAAEAQAEADQVAADGVEGVDRPVSASSKASGAASQPSAAAATKDVEPAQMAVFGAPGSMRWCLPAGTSARFKVTFTPPSGAEGRFEDRFAFAVAGTRLRSILPVRADAVLPRVVSDPRNVFPHRLQAAAPGGAARASRPGAPVRVVRRRWVVSRGEFEFGPLLAGKPQANDAGDAGSGPGTTSQHCEHLRFTNDGVMPATLALGLAGPDKVEPLAFDDRGQAALTSTDELVLKRGAVVGGVPLSERVGKPGVPPPTAEEEEEGQAAAGSAFRVEPRQVGPLAPGESADVCVWAHPSLLARYRNAVVAAVEGSATPVVLPLTATGAAPRCSLHGPWEANVRAPAAEKEGEDEGDGAAVPCLDLGRELVGRQAERDISLCNDSDIAVEWRFKPSALARLPASAQVLPSSGVLQPRQSVPILVSLRSEEPVLIEAAELPVEIAAAEWGLPEAAAGDEEEGGDAAGAAAAADKGGKKGGKKDDKKKGGKDKGGKKGGKGKEEPVEDTGPSATPPPRVQTLGFSMSAEAYEVKSQVDWSRSGAPEGSEGLLDFGVCRVGEVVRRSFALQNEGKYPIAFSAGLYQRGPTAASLPSLLTVRPAHGEVSPGGSAQVEVLFWSSRGREARLAGARAVQVQVQEAATGELMDSFVVGANAEAVFSRVSVLPSAGIHFGALRYDTKRERQVEIRNEGRFPVWVRAASVGSEDEAKAIRRAQLEQELRSLVGQRLVEWQPREEEEGGDAAAAAAAADKGGKKGGKKDDKKKSGKDKGGKKGGKDKGGKKGGKDKKKGGGGGDDDGDALVDGPFKLSPCSLGCELDAAIEELEAQLAALQEAMQANEPPPEEDDDEEASADPELLQPGEARQVLVTFEAKGAVASTARVRFIAGGWDLGTDPRFDGMVHELAGESCAPGLLVSDLAGAFEEQRVVPQLVPDRDAEAAARAVRQQEKEAFRATTRRLGETAGQLDEEGDDDDEEHDAQGGAGLHIGGPGRTVFALQEKALSFGAVLPAAHPRGVEERIRLTNPTKVDAEVHVGLFKRTRAAAAAAGEPAGDNPQGEGAAVPAKPDAPAGSVEAEAGTKLGAFTVSPTNFTIPAREARYVTVRFLPAAMREYRAALRACVPAALEDGLRELEVTLQGEGALPSVTVEEPTARGADGRLAVSLGRVRAGHVATRRIVLRNSGAVPASARLDIIRSAAELSATAAEEEAAVGGAVGGLRVGGAASLGRASLPEGLYVSDAGRTLTLRPGQRHEVEVRCAPADCREAALLEGLLQLSVSHNDYAKETLRLAAAVLPSTVDVEEVVAPEAMGRASIIPPRNRPDGSPAATTEEAAAAGAEAEEAVARAEEAGLQAMRPDDCDVIDFGHILLSGGAEAAADGGGLGSRVLLKLRNRGTWPVRAVMPKHEQVAFTPALFHIAAGQTAEVAAEFVPGSAEAAAAAGGQPGEEGEQAAGAIKDALQRIVWQPITYDAQVAAAFQAQRRSALAEASGTGAAAADKKGSKKDKGKGGKKGGKKDDKKKGGKDKGGKKGGKGKEEPAEDTGPALDLDGAEPAIQDPLHPEPVVSWTCEHGAQVSFVEGAEAEQAREEAEKAAAVADAESQLLGCAPGAVPAAVAFTARDDEGEEAGASRGRVVRLAAEPDWAPAEWLVLRTVAGGNGEGKEEEEEEAGGAGEEADKLTAPLRSAGLLLRGAATPVAVSLSTERLVFKPTMMLLSRTAEVTVTNASSAAVPFSWEMLEQREANPEADGVPDVGPAFSVQPMTGMVPAHGECKVTVRFAPEEVDDFGATALLHAGSSSPDAEGALLARLDMAGRSQRPICHVELPRSDYLARRDPSRPRPDGDAAPLDGSVRVIEFVALGTGQSVTNRFHVVNPTAAGYELHWSRVVPAGAPGGAAQAAAASPFTCRTPSSVALGGRRCEVQFEYHPRASDRVEEMWRLSVPSQRVSQLFLVTGVVREPRVSLDRPAVLFRQLLVGSRGLEVAHLVNDEAQPFHFNFNMEQARMADDDPVDAVAAAAVGARRRIPPTLRVKPESGVVPARGRIPIELALVPRQEKRYNLSLRCDVDRKSQPLMLNVKGEGYVIKERVVVTAGGASHAAVAGAGEEQATGVTESDVSPFGAAAGPSASGFPLSLGHTQVGERSGRAVTLRNAGTVNYDFRCIVLPMREAVTEARQLAVAVAGGRARRPGSASSMDSNEARRRRLERAQDALEVKPRVGKVLAGSQVEVELAFRPQEPLAVRGLALLVVVAGTRPYLFALDGQATQPAVRIEPSQVEFGRCFLPSHPAAPPRRYRQFVRVSNLDPSKDLSLELPWAGRPDLDLPVSSCLVAPGETVELPLIFSPRSAAAVAERIPVEVNGLPYAPLLVRGQGTPLAVQLADPSQADLRLGGVRVGDVVRRAVQVVNASHRAAEFAITASPLAPADRPLTGAGSTVGGGAGAGSEPDKLDAAGVVINPKRLALRPGERAVVNVSFAPSRRVAAFDEPVWAVPVPEPAEEEEEQRRLAATMRRDDAEGAASAAGSSPSKKQLRSDGRPEVQALRLFQVSGSGQGLAVSLDQERVTFGSVCVGSKQTRQVLLLNTGDVPARWGVDTHRLAGTAFSVFPTGGNVPAQSETVVEVGFSPQEVHSAAGGESPASEEVRVDSLPFLVEGRSAPLLMSLGGVAVPRPGAEGAPIAFNCPARGQDTKDVPLPKNESSKPFTYTPSVDSAHWKAAGSVTLQPGESGSLKLTYHPLEMTGPEGGDGDSPRQARFERPEKHAGSLFVALPDGGGRLLQLEGTAGPPELQGKLEEAAPARSLAKFVVAVPNWLSRSQRFEVGWGEGGDRSRAPAQLRVRGAAAVEVPPRGEREYTLSVSAHVPGEFQLPLRFTASETGEYCEFALTLKAGEPGEAGELALETAARRRVTRTVAVPNPLAAAGEEVTFTELKCEHPAVEVRQVGEVTGQAEAMFEVAYLPLLATTTAAAGAGSGVRAAAAAAAGAGSETATLSLQSPQLGRFQYNLRLTAAPAPAEAALRVRSCLGRRQLAEAAFTHLLTAAATYKVTVAGSGAASFECPESVSAPAGPENRSGVEVSLPVTFAPVSAGDHSADLLLESETGGTFQIPLFGSAMPPQPAGPFYAPPGGAVTVPFRNPFAEAVEFAAAVDGPPFELAGPLGSVAAKGEASLTVRCAGGREEGAPVAAGKLLVRAPSGETWVFFLRGEEAPPDAEEEAGGAAGGGKGKGKKGKKK